MLTPHKIRVFTKYKNLSGKSIVARYEIMKDGMTIRFTDHSVYIYTNQTADPKNISKMKALAIAGKGLGTFIEANLKDRYLRKVR